MSQLAQRTDIQDDFYGTVVPDPYRWLEDPTAEETQAFVAAQNARTQSYLEATGLRPALQARLLTLQNYPKWSAPIRRGGLYFFTMNTGLQNQAVTYAQKGLAGEPRVIIDPNTLSADGTASLTTQSFSRDGAWLAYGVSHGGSDWQQIHVRRVADGSELPETIDWCRYAIAAWAPDGSGFFYARFPAADEVAPEDRTNYSRIYWHTLDTPQSADPVIYSRPDAKELSFSPTVTEDGVYLVLRVSHGTDTEHRFYYRPLASTDDFVRLLDDADAAYIFIGNTGPLFYFWTTLQAPRGRIIAIDTAHPQRAAWRELVPEGADPISQATMVHGQFMVLRMRDAHHELFRYALDGTPLGAIPLPGLGTVIELAGKAPDDHLFFNFTSFLQPPSIFRYDFAAAEVTRWQGPALPFDTTAYVTEQVFYPSKDGTRIPMFLTHKRDLVRDANNLTLLYNDAYAHLVIARRVFDNTTPGLAQLGGVWLPLPHLIMLPFVWSDTLFRSGMAGSFSSMPCYVIAACFIFLAARRITHNSRASFIGAMIFMLNPGVLYMQTTPLTEPVLIATMTAACYFFLAWVQDDQPRWLIWAAASTSLATLARYDGWFLYVVFLGCIIVIDMMQHRKFRQLEDHLLLFGSFGGLGIALWFLWNWMIFHDPLYFQNGPYSSQTQQMLVLHGGALTTYHNAWEAFRHFLYASAETVGPVLLGMAIIGLIVFTARKRLSPEVVGALPFVAPFVFYVIALFTGQAVLFVPGAVPANASNIFYNARYGTEIVAPVAFFVAILIGRQVWVQFGFVAVILLQSALIAHGGIIALQDGQ